MVMNPGTGPSSRAGSAPGAPLDDTDRTILGMLLRDGRSSLDELAAAAGLSTSATSVRVRKLIDQGVIAGFHARLDLAAVGRPLEALVQVQAHPDADLAAFEGLLAGTPALVSAWQITGEYDYAVHLACRSLRDLETELRRVRRQPGVRRVASQLLLHPVAGGLGLADAGPRLGAA